MPSRPSPRRELRDAYRFPGFIPQRTVVGIFGDPQARIITLTRRAKKQSAVRVDERSARGTIGRSVGCAICRVAICGWRPIRATRNASRCTSANSVARRRSRRWPRTGTGTRSRRWTSSTCASNWRARREPRPGIIGIGEIAIRKGHVYRIVVSDLEREHPIWFGGIDRSEESLAMFYDFLGEKHSQGMRLAVMDMWKAFRKATDMHAPQAAILYDKFHVLRHLSDAMDKVRKTEYKRLTNRRDRKYIKGQWYVLLSHRENLSPEKRKGACNLVACDTTGW